MTDVNERPASDTWWDTIKGALDTPIADLGDDFATIADQASPRAGSPPATLVTRGDCP